jgi:capsular polysaccharide biosynthesis protein
LQNSPQALVATGTHRAPADSVLVTSLSDTTHFGHWLFDCLPRALIAQALGLPVSAHPGLSVNQRRYMELLGLDALPLRDAFFPSLIVLDDVGQNDDKRRRYGELRERMRKTVAAPERNHGVMLLRGTTGVRRVLVNEDEVMAAAMKRGYRVLDPVSAPVDEIAAACLDADIVLGVEGSQLVNGQMWMSPRGTVVSLQPPTRFTTVLKDRCDCEGMAYAFMVGDPRGDTSFWIDTDAMNRLLDRVESLQR